MWLCEGWHGMFRPCPKRMYSLSINHTGELMGHLADPGSPGKTAIKMEYVCHLQQWDQFLFVRMSGRWGNSSGNPRCWDDCKTWGTVKVQERGWPHSSPFRLYIRSLCTHYLYSVPTFLICKKKQYPLDTRSNVVFCSFPVVSPRVGCVMDHWSQPAASHIAFTSVNLGPDLQKTLRLS